MSSEMVAESVGLAIAERIRQEMTSGRQWWLGALTPAQRQEFETDLASTCVAVCEDELSGFTRQQAEARATAGAEVPDGWKLVPVEPTPEMLIAMGRSADDFLSKPGPYPRSSAVYAAMLAAVPASPTEAPGSEGAGWKSGDVAYYTGAGSPISVTLLADDEGWWEVRCSDDSTAVVRPSRLSRLALNEQEGG